MTSRRTSWTLGLLALVVLGLAGLPLVEDDANVDASHTTANAARTETPAPPARPVDPNGEWFVSGDPGTEMKANEVIDDPDRFPLYFDDAEARVYRRNGVGLIRMRSYYAGAQGGATLKVVTTQDVRALLRDLDRIDGGLGRRYPALPHGRLRRNVVQMENTRAHDVFAHFYAITFAEGHHVVTVEAYGTTAPVGRRRAVTYARRERDLLAQRAHG
ncbi:MAG TPA: hypothetical protein VK923_07710 [Euzebyales bacterium]|nr:hypothetical protein [Euzebyales bacterium]